MTLITAATGSCIKATRPSPAASAAAIVESFCIWLNAAGTVMTVPVRSEEHTSELQSLMRSSYAVFCLKKKNNKQADITTYTQYLHLNTLINSKRLSQYEC